MREREWIFVNVEERAAACAAASVEFKIPSKRARSSLKFGDFAKLICETRGGDGIADMWVCVLEVTCVLELNGRGVYYTGSLMEPGRRIKFRPHHVADIDSLDTRASASHACH